MRVEQIGSATLYCASCVDVLPLLTEFDAVVTDPPYGVDGGSGTLGGASTKTKYRSAAFADTREYVLETIVPALASALKIAKRGIVTPGTPCMFLYPEPADVGAIFQPATTGLNKWGLETTQPVLYYGKDPRAGKTIAAKHYMNTARSEDNGHPCPKPIGVAKWMVHRASLDDEIVFDPFMGSGTTGVACVDLHRKFIGVEIEPRYFDIACRRIEDAQRQGRLIA